MTNSQRAISVPPPSDVIFTDGIRHPDLWLWDAWSCRFEDGFRLFTLAIARHDADGHPTTPERRNDYPFHIRQFASQDDGKSWRDLGVFLAPGDEPIRRNVWSGSVIPDRDGLLTGITGIAEAPGDRQFLQSICIGRSSDGRSCDWVQDEPLSCPSRDYDEIRAAGYYLGPKEALGTSAGEEGGPLLAWRDPYLVRDDGGSLHAFWSAKVSPREGAVAHARLREERSGFAIEQLYAPMRLPDADVMTQAEVPKIVRDPSGEGYFLLVSACDRINERQPPEEVTKQLRLYLGDSMRGPWASAGPTSALSSCDHLFGADVLMAEPDALHLIAPYTEYATEDRQLTIAPLCRVNHPTAIKTLQAARG